jgi:hypothetical protein
MKKAFFNAKKGSKENFEKISVWVSAGQPVELSPKQLVYQFLNIIYVPVIFFNKIFLKNPNINLKTLTNSHKIYHIFRLCLED